VNVQLNTVSPTRKSLVVSLDASEVESEHRAVVTEFVAQARIPGFRPGKAPAPMIARRFGKEIDGEFKQKLVAKAYRAALEKEKLPVLNVVNVQEGTIELGKPAEVTVTVDIRPDFELPDLANFSVELETTDVTDAEIDQVIEGMRAERADFKPASRPAAKGDYVKLAYEGKIAGQPIAELAPDKQLYGKVPQTWEEVEGANEGHLPGLGKLLSGLSAGDKKTVQIVFPAEFDALPAVAGKTADYDLEILEIRERVLPELDEAFLKSNQAADVPALREQVNKNLARQKEYRNNAEQRRQVTDALAEKAGFPVPESLVETETQAVLRQFIEENMRRGVPAEQFEKDKAELHAGAKVAAEKRVKLQLMLARIAENEKIEISERDLDEYIYRHATRSGIKPEKFAKDLAKNRDQLRSIQESIIFDKAVDFLASKAKVSTRPAAAS
jgi:trigger factor